jgi:hypothetical protein
MSLDVKFAKHANAVDDAGRARDTNYYTLPLTFLFVPELVHGYTLFKIGARGDFYCNHLPSIAPPS